MLLSLNDAFRDSTLSVADGFSNTFKTPCVVFTGHPSLRFGDVVHFVEMWGNSSANTIIFTGAHKVVKKLINDI